MYAFLYIHADYFAKVEIMFYFSHLKLPETRQSIHNQSVCGVDSEQSVEIRPSVVVNMQPFATC